MSPAHSRAEITRGSFDVIYGIKYVRFKYFHGDLKFSGVFLYQLAVLARVLKKLEDTPVLQAQIRVVRQYRAKRQFKERMKNNALPEPAIVDICIKEDENMTKEETIEQKEREIREKDQLIQELQQKIVGCSWFIFFIVSA